MNNIDIGLLLDSAAKFINCIKGVLNENNSSIDDDIDLKELESELVKGVVNKITTKKNDEESSLKFLCTTGSSNYYSNGFTIIVKSVAATYIYSRKKRKLINSQNQKEYKSELADDLYDRFIANKMPIYASYENV